MPALPVPDGLPSRHEAELLATDSSARAIVYDLCASDLFLALKKGKSKKARWWRRRMRQIATTYDRYSEECIRESDSHWADAEVGE